MPNGSWPSFRSAQLLEASGQIAAAAENIDGIAFVAHRVPDGTDADAMRSLALDVRSKIPAPQPAVVALIGTPADRPVVVIAVNEAGRGLGLAAGALVGGGGQGARRRWRRQAGHRAGRRRPRFRPG